MSHDVKTLNSDGSVFKERVSVHGLIMDELETVETVRAAMPRSPDRSAKKAAADLGTSRRSLQRIL